MRGLSSKSDSKTILSSSCAEVGYINTPHSSDSTYPRRRQSGNQDQKRDPYNRDAECSESVRKKLSTVQPKSYCSNTNAVHAHHELVAGVAGAAASLASLGASS